MNKKTPKGASKPSKDLADKYKAASNAIEPKKASGGEELSDDELAGVSGGLGGVRPALRAASEATRFRS